MGGGNSHRPYFDKKRDMKYIFDKIRAVNDLLGKKKVLLMLDYDGTVVPIAKTPSQAILSASSRKIFEKTAKNPRIKLAFISGRSLSEIKKMAGINGIFYAGNHGLEIEGPRTRFVHGKAHELSADLRTVFEHLSKKLCGYKGVLIEDKNLSISIHFRLASAADEKNIKAEVKAAVDQGKFRLSGGKKVLEIRPKEKWDKGNAANFLADKFKSFFPVYIGDDRTDEDAFSALKNKGLTIFVGRPGKSAAHYFVKDHKEVMRFLKTIGQRSQA